jgi:4a-hydroxytetrahydrobiopterin dehydratase
MAVPESEQPLPEPLLSELLAELDGWQRDGPAITKTYALKGWKSALAFVNKVGEAAVRADHHPDIHIERYKNVRIVLTTHATKGISRADVDLAAVIDKIAAAT